MACPRDEATVGLGSLPSPRREGCVFWNYMLMSIYSPSAGTVVQCLSAALGQIADVLKGQGAPMMILDELDSGVGGRLGSTVGQLLKRLASSATSGTVSQVICVSHLPQVWLSLPVKTGSYQSHSILFHQAVLGRCKYLDYTSDFSTSW